MLCKEEELLERVMVLDLELLQLVLERQLADLELQHHDQVLLLQDLDHLDLQDQIQLEDQVAAALEIIVLTDHHLQT